jgi:hypothetical protein
VLQQPAEAGVGAADRFLPGEVFDLAAGGAAVGGDGVAGAGGSSPVKVSGAEARRRCRVRQLASMQISTCAFTPSSRWWQTGRRPRSLDLLDRKSRSTFLRCL